MGEDDNQSSVSGLATRLGNTAITLLSGSMAAICGSYVKQPIQRIKWLRQVSEKGTTLETQSLFCTLRSIIKNEGFFHGLWRGSIATITRNIPHAALVYTAFPIYYDLLSNPQSSMFLSTLASEDSDRRNLPLVRACAGAMSSFTVTIITHPLDTLRVRIATQYAANRQGDLPYPSLRLGVKTIYDSEGISAFYRGLQISLIGTMIRGGVGFSVYETLKSEDWFDLENQRRNEYNSDEEGMKNKNTKSRLMNKLSVSDTSKRLMCGLAAGMSTTFLCQPIDTVRRRQQVYSARRILSDSELHNLGGKFGQSSHSMTSSVAFILRNEGITGFYKGLSLGLIKSPLAIAVSFSVNDLVKLLFGVNLGAKKTRE